MNNSCAGLLLLVLGPSGVGKGTLLKRFVENHPHVSFVLSHTTRKIRPSEKNGINRYFVNKSTFNQMIKNDEFLEWAKVYDMDYYGTAKKSVIEPLNEGRVLIKEVDIEGLNIMKTKIPNENIFSVFVMPEKLDDLRSRIMSRGVLPDEELRARLKVAESEMLKNTLCDYTLINKQGKVDEAYRELERLFLHKIKERGIVL